MLAGWAAGRPPQKLPPRKGVTGQPESDRAMNGASRLSAGGQAGNIALADDIFSESTGVNGVVAGVAGSKRRLPERLAGFPELSIHNVDMFSAGDKICYASRLARTLAWPYRCRGGRPAGGRCGLCCWGSEGGKVAEISTIQDRFTPLKRIRCLPPRDLRGVGALAGAQARRRVRDVARTCTGSRILVCDCACRPGLPRGVPGNGRGRRQ